MNFSSVQIQSMTERDRVAAYFRGDEEIVDALWWVKHWQWRWSPGWVRCCVYHEAVCLMAWEAAIPELTDEQRNIFDMLRELNSFAKTLSYTTNGQKQIYWLKREVIRWAVLDGLGNIREVGKVVSCRSCGGSGRYWLQFDDRWEADGDYVHCRRCGGGGAVKLTFHEIDIAGQYTFHQPTGHTTPFASNQISWLPTHHAPFLELNRSGKKLDWEQATDMVLSLKRRFWDHQPHYTKDIYSYMNQPPCFGRGF